MPASVVDRLRAAGCVFAEDEARLLIAAAPADDELEGLVARRVAGEPLEHLLGWVEFCGLRLAIGPGVFVPRRRTEFLARSAAAAIRSGEVLVDLCCGCGAIAAAVAAAVPGVEVYAADVAEAAVECARRNVPGSVRQSDLYAGLPAELRGRVAVLTGNAPYVPTDKIATMPVEARVHEPQVALDGGPDGMDVLRRIIAEAPDWLAPGGWLFVESSTAQAPLLAARFGAVGLGAEIRADAGVGAIVAGRLG